MDQIQHPLQPAATFIMSENNIPENSDKTDTINIDKEHAQIPPITGSQQSISNDINIIITIPIIFIMLYRIYTNCIDTIGCK